MQYSQSIDGADVVVWLIICIVFLTVNCFIVFNKSFKFRPTLYFPGVSYYLMYLLSYSLIFQNLGIYMYTGKLIVGF